MKIVFNTRGIHSLIYGGKNNSKVNGGYWQEATNLRYFEVCANLRSTGKNANISTLMEMESLGDTYT